MARDTVTHYHKKVTRFYIHDLTSDWTISQHLLASACTSYSCFKETELKEQRYAQKTVIHAA
jgi:hypothetical protein